MPHTKYLDAGFLSSPVAVALPLTILLWLWASTALAQSPTTRPLVGLQEHVPSTFVLQNATVIQRPGQRLESVSVVVVDGLIDDIASDPQLPPDARVIDCEGKTIYPGFIDAYSEMEIEWESTGQSHWNERVHPELRVADFYQEERRVNQEYRKSGFVARLVSVKDGQIKGISAIVSTADGDGSQRILKEDVALHATLTARRGREEYPGSPMGAVALFRQAFYDAQWYEDAWKTYRANNGLEKPESNSALAMLAEVTESGMPVIIDSSNERYFLRADRFGREFRLPVIVRGSGREYRRLKEVLETERPIILPLDFPKAPDVSTAESARRATLQQLMHWDHAPENPVRLIEGKATVAFTTDGLDKSAQLIPAVRKAIKRGLSEEDALAALTLNTAKMFGVENRLGTVEAGKLASLLITNGPIFEKKTKILETWVEGQRTIHSREPFDLRGSWQITVDQEGEPAAMEVRLKGSARKLAGEIKTDDKPIKLQSVRFTDTHLSFAFPTDHWDQKGIAQLTIVVDADELADEEFVGRGVWPDGTSFSCKVTWSESKATEDGEDDGTEEVDEGNADEDDATEEIAGEEADEIADEIAEQETDEDEAQTAEDIEVDETATDDAEADVASSEKDEATAVEEEAGEDSAVEDNEVGEEEGGDEEVAQENDPSLNDPLFPVNYPLGGYGFERAPERPSVVVFQGATVWTCSDQGKLEDAMVIVRDGKIEAVGTDLAVPASAEVIDATGKHLSPGIIDCHSHIATDGGVNESTQAITAEVRIGDFVDPDDISIYRQLAGGTTLANVLHGSANPIGGQNQVIKMRWGVAPEALKFKAAPGGIKFALGENVKQSNWGDDHRTRYPQTRMGVDEIQADAFRRAIAYRRRQTEWNTSRRGLPPRKDLELEALAEIVEGKRWIHCHSYRQSEIMALMKTCDEFGITIGTFQHILEGYKVADEMAKRGVMGSAFADWWAYKFEVYDAIPHAGALMHNAGVVVSFNSDDAELGRHLNIDAAKAMKYGNVPEEEALKFVTLNPARQLRIEDRVGSLEAGKDADLVVWSHAPLSIYAVCEQTWIDGRKYFSKEDETQLRDRDASRHAALVQRILATNAAQRKPGEDEKSRDELWPRHDTFCHGHDGHGHGEHRHE